MDHSFYENQPDWGMTEDERFDLCEAEFLSRAGWGRRRVAASIQQPAPPKPYFWESRRVINDAMVGQWGPLPEVKGASKECLLSYLTDLYRREVELNGTFDPNVLDDGEWQYRLAKSE